MAQRTSSTAQLLQGSADGARAGGVNANRPRPRGPTRSSSPVMMQAVRQAALQDSPPAQVRWTPPSLRGLIPPNVNPPPILRRANTENPTATVAVATGVPPHVSNYQRSNTIGLPGSRNPLGATSYLSDRPSNGPLPFKYDQDDDDVHDKSLQQHFASQPQPHPRNRTSVDSFCRDQQDSRSPNHIRTVPNQAPTSITQPQVPIQAVSRPNLYRSQPSSARTGSRIRAPPTWSFPVFHEEADDEVVAVPQQQPAARSQPSHSSPQPPPAARLVTRSRGRERSPDEVRVPFPQPAPPAQHPPLPLFSLRSVQARQLAALRDSGPKSDSSTPSPPALRRIDPDAGNRHQTEEDLEPAEPSSESFTPKSPNVALPVDHAYTYANNNYGRMGSHNRMPQPAPDSPVDPYYLPLQSNNPLQSLPSRDDTQVQEQLSLTQIEGQDQPHRTTRPLDDDIGSSVVSISPNAVKINGHFCDVFEGLHITAGKVALKRPRVGATGYDKTVMRRLEREAMTWRALQHPHILKFLGTFRHGGHLYFASPFIENGTLLEYVICHPDVNRIKLLCEAADAIAYLHQNQIVHGDIKGSNILIHDDGHVLLCDFGLTKVVHSKTSPPLRGAGTSRWQSPELLEDAHKSFSSDTYAFAMTIVEVITGEAPFAHIKNDNTVIYRVLQKDERPPKKPLQSSTGISYLNTWEVAEACWSKTWEDRISMPLAFERLRNDPALLS